MLNNKYDNIALVPISIFMLFGIIWLSFKVYGLILETSAEGIISSLKTSYNSQLNSEENSGINNTIEGYNKTVLDAYEKNLQGIFSRYEFFEFYLKLNNKIENNHYPMNFNELDRENFISLEKFDNINLDISLNKRNLQIIGQINKRNMSNYKTKGTWAIYFNDKLHYSSNFFITDESNESIGSHIFRYKFSEDKDIYLRIVYKFENIEKATEEFLVYEEILSIMK